MHTVFALLCFVVVIHWLIVPYPSGLLHWHCGNLTIAPVPAKQPWWIWINTSYEFIMNDFITTTKQSTTKPCAYFLGYTVYASSRTNRSSNDMDYIRVFQHDDSLPHYGMRILTPPLPMPHICISESGHHCKIPWNSMELEILLLKFHGTPWNHRCCSNVVQKVP